MEENINCKELFCALFVNIVENTKVFPMFSGPTQRRAPKLDVFTYIKPAMLFIF